MIKKTVLTAGLVFAVVSAGLFIWVLWPGERVELRQLVPADSLAVVSFKLERSNEGLRDLIKNLHLGPGRRFLLPTEVAVAVVANQEIGYIILFESNRAAKLIRLLRPWAGKWIGRPYAIFKNVVIVSDNGKLIKRVRMGDWEWKTGNGQGSIFVDNRDEKLTQVVRSFEKGSSFSLFPAVESVEEIEGNFHIGKRGEIKGILTFRLRKRSEGGEVKKDILFLGQLIRRFCKTKSLNFVEELRMGDGYVDLNFEVQGLKEALKNKNR